MARAKTLKEVQAQLDMLQAQRNAALDAFGRFTASEDGRAQPGQVLIRQRMAIYEYFEAQERDLLVLQRWLMDGGSRAEAEVVEAARALIGKMAQGDLCADDLVKLRDAVAALPAKAGGSAKPAGQVD